MKIKFGELTLNQFNSICRNTKSCEECPFHFTTRSLGVKCKSDFLSKYKDEEVEINDSSDKFDLIISNLKNSVQPKLSVSSEGTVLIK